MPDTSTHMVLFLFLFLSNAEQALSRFLVPFPAKINHRGTKERKYHINLWETQGLMGQFCAGMTWTQGRQKAFKFLSWVISWMISFHKYIYFIMLLYRTFLEAYADLWVISPHYFMYLKTLIFWGLTFVCRHFSSPISVVTLHVPIVTLITLMSTLIYI